MTPLEQALGPRKTTIDAATLAIVREMPKAELHLHLDGSLRVGTALEIARSRGVEGAPADEAGIRSILMPPPQVVDQAELLRAFDLPIALMQDAEALERIAYELVETKAREGVRYAEIRWGPALHVARGLSLEDGIDAVIRGGSAAARDAGAAGRPIVVRWICTALRSHTPETNLRLARAASSFRDRGLVGWDFAGPEARYPDPTPHAVAFAAAREGGLRITIHAGEWGGADQVRRALAVDPERIAHGPGAADDAKLMEELALRGITLDLCPTSNAQASIVPTVADHPIAWLHRFGVPVTLNTDDVTVSDLLLTDEYVRALERIGLTLQELWAIDRFALDVAFAADADLAPLRAAFDAWAAAHPEVQGPA